jgi:filamentous hemagglutinin family protein
MDNSLVFGLCAAVMSGAASLCAQSALAEPTCPRVVAGSGAVTNAGANTVIQQTSSRLAIDWNSFSSRANESITFNQPGANAIALNRVVGQSPSVLLGKLNANGQVFVINPRGVLFGPGAQVNVGGLIASTLDLSDSDFLSGHYAFAGADGRSHRDRVSFGRRFDGTVVNLGDIQSAPGGYVALIGARVVNGGTIVAPGGVASLAAGGRVTVTLGDHSMIGLTIDPGTLRAIAANHGLIQADGGQAWLEASSEDALFASVVNNTGIVRAQSAVNQNGVIRLVANGGAALTDGVLDASAPNGGNGGAVSISGAQVRIAPETKVTTAAVSGKTGELSVAGTSDMMMSGAMLSGLLDTTSVSLAAPDITLTGDPAAWRTPNALSLSAAHDVAIDTAIDATNGALSIGAGGMATQRAPIGVPRLTLNGGGQFALTDASNRIGTVAANADSVTLTDGAPLAVAGIAANGAVTLVAPAITLDAPVTSRANGTAITLSSAAFDNRAGPAALVTPNGRWIVYSASPDADTFGGLQSGNLALWGDAYMGAAGGVGGVDARAAASAGNRFAFNAEQQITLSAVNIDKPVDTTRALGPNDVTIALRYDGTNYGSAFADSPSTHEPFAFTVTSTGATPGAASGDYIITITSIDGPAGYQITTQSGTLRVNSVTAFAGFAGFANITGSAGSASNARATRFSATAPDPRFRSHRCHRSASRRHAAARCAAVFHAARADAHRFVERR